MQTKSRPARAVAIARTQNDLAFSFWESLAFAAATLTAWFSLPLVWPGL